MHIVIGLLLGVIGILILKYSFPLKNLFGNWQWAERYLGAGGTHSAWKLIGLGCMVFGLLWGTGTLGNMLAGFFGMFFSGTV